MSRPPKQSTPNELAQLASMARTRAPGLSDVTLRVQTDLLIAGGQPPAEMAQAYAALFEALLPRVEPRTAEIVIGKLIAWPSLPPALEHLVAAYRHPAPSLADIPQPMTPWNAPPASCDVLSAPEPLQPVTSPEAAPAIRHVTEGVPETMTAPDSRSSSHDLQHLLQQARGDKALARTLARQPDLPALALAPLFADADMPARTRILLALQRHIEIAPIARPPQASADEIEQIIARMRSEPVEATRQMAAILDGGEPLAAALAIDLDRTLTTLAAIAMGFEPTETVRLLLVAGDDVAKSTRQVLSLAELARNITAPVALKLVAAMTGVPVAKPAGAGGRQHLPQAAPSGTPTRTVDRPARKLEWTVHLSKPAGTTG